MKLRRKTLARVGIASAAVAGAALVTAPVAMAAASLNFALITNPTTGQKMNSGGSQDAWQVQASPNGFCTGSSQNGYFVTGYVTDQSDPTSITFDATGNPVTASGVTFSLYDSSLSQYIERNTAPPAPGQQAGQVLPSGPMTWAAFDTSSLPPGTYHVGLACVFVSNGTRTLDKVFDTSVQFTADVADPGGFTWQTVPNPQVPEFPMTAVLPVSAAVVVAAGGYAIHRRRRTSVNTAA
jgi:hypothetical protein